MLKILVLFCGLPKLYYDKHALIEGQTLVPWKFMRILLSSAKQHDLAITSWFMH